MVSLARSVFKIPLALLILQSMAQTVIDIAAERERIEDIIKKDLTENPASPGHRLRLGIGLWSPFVV